VRAVHRCVGTRAAETRHVVKNARDVKNERVVENVENAKVSKECKDWQECWCFAVTFMNWRAQHELACAANVGARCHDACYLRCQSHVPAARFEPVMYICMYACIYTNIYTYTHIHTCVSVSICICMSSAVSC
jgi:hypothetical protein